MRSRGAGISGLSRQTASSASYAALSSTISSQQVSDLSSQLDAFKAALVVFSKAHRNDIRKDPALRHKFQMMCAAIGVDPLASSGQGGGAGGSGVSGGFWQDILGTSDWQYELAVQAVDICVSTRERNGGVIEMEDLLRRLARLRGSMDISAEDVIRSIKTLSPLGSGYEVIKIGGQTFIRSVPRELDIDQGSLLSFAAGHGGVFNERMIMQMLGWNDVRARNAIDNMVKRDGLGWVDEQAEGGVDVWVPSTLNWQET